MKKIIVSVMVCLVSIFMISSLSGCYIVESGTKDQIAGTYKLIRKEFDNEDLIKKNNIVEYLVIGKENSGIRYYKDYSLSEYVCQEIAVEYFPDTEKEGLFRNIEFTIYKKDSYNNVDSSKIQLGVNKSEKTLTTGNVEIKGEYISAKQQYTTYKKISSETDKSEIEKQLGFSVNVIPFEMAEYLSPFNINMHYTEIETGTCINVDYLYYIMDFNVLNNKVDIYYALKSDGVKKENKNVSYTVNVADSGKTCFTIEGIDYVSDGFGFLRKEFVLDGVNYEQTYHRIENGKVDDIIENAMKNFVATEK